MAKRKENLKSIGSELESPKRPNRGTGPIFADIDGEVRRRFHEISRLEKFSEKSAIEALVRHFVESLDGAERRAMLQGEKSAVQSLAKAIELFQWGQHSFTNKRWEWCMKVNIEIIKECKGNTEIARFANYRLGYCALSMAEGIRQEVLIAVIAGDKDGSELGHRAFENAAKAGIHYSRKSIEAGDMEIAHFNMSCGLVLQAENAALKAIDWSSRDNWLRKLRGEISKWLALVAAGDEADIREEHRANLRWSKNFAGGWREFLQRSGQTGSVTERLVNSALSAAISELKKTVDLPSHPTVPGDARELVRASSTISDLTFLKYDSEYSEAFRTWGKANEPTSSRLKSFMMLWSNLKDAPAIEAQELAREPDDL